jgi:hypothetical protein
MVGGTNPCTFQLALDEAAAAAVEACLDEPELPVVVTYAMTYEELRPAFTVDIRADWHKVYSTLQNRLTANVWVAAADVDIAITQALEENGIHVDTVVEGDAAAAAAAERTRAQLLDWVLDRMFVPMAPPTGVAQTVGDVVEDAVWSLTRAVLPGVSYRLKVVDETQLRHLDARATERVAQARELRAQGLLGGLLRRLRVDEHGDPSPQWPAIRESLVQQVELDAFPRLEVAVDVLDRFGTDGLRSVRVQLARRRPDGSRVDPAELSFTSGPEPRSWVVNLLDEAARREVWDAGYAYRVLVDFDPDAPLRPAAAAARDGSPDGEPEADAVSPWRSQRAGELLVDPREAYDVTDVTVTATPLLSFALFPVVDVELRAQDGDRTAHVTLTADSPLQRWQYASDAERTPYLWRASYRRGLEAGGDVTTPWSEALDPWLSLPDPMPEKLQVTFFVDLPWDAVAVALLQLRYDDDEHDVHYAEETVTLGPSTTALSRTYSIAAGGPRAVEYRLTVKLAAGGFVEGSWRTADDDRIVVDRRLVDERQVRVRAVGGTLAEHGLSQAVLTLQTRDPQTQAVRDSHVTRIVPGAETGFADVFTYLPGDPPLTTVFHQLQVVNADGFVRSRPWDSTRSDLLVVDLRSQSVSA